VYVTGSIYLRLTGFTLLFDIVVLLFLYYNPPWYISGLYSMRHTFRVGGASPVFRNMQRFISYKQQKLCGICMPHLRSIFLIFLCVHSYDPLNEEYPQKCVLRHNVSSILSSTRHLTINDRPDMFIVKSILVKCQHNIYKHID
jgi:hypothetical protein